MKIIGVTNRLLCENDFFEQIENICKQNLYALILREKDLDDNTYEDFAIKCNDICNKNNVLFFINTKINIAQKLKIKNIQVSFKDFVDNKDVLCSFDNVGISVHSLEEATEVKRCIEVWMYREKATTRSLIKCGMTKKTSVLMTEKANRLMTDNNRKNLFLIAGHIFETDCKKGLKPRGTDFLKEICNNVDIPVFAIGGIKETTINQLKNIKIEGICLMSALMKKSPCDFFSL